MAWHGLARRRRNRSDSGGKLDLFGRSRLHDVAAWEAAAGLLLQRATPAEPGAAGHRRGRQPALRGGGAWRGVVGPAGQIQLALAIAKLPRGLARAGAAEVEAADWSEPQTEKDVVARRRPRGPEGLSTITHLGACDYGLFPDLCLRLCTCMEDFPLKMYGTYTYIRLWLAYPFILDGEV